MLYTSQPQPIPPVPATDLRYCFQHHDRATLLCCNRCNRPICPQCSRKTEVGYRCPACVQQIQNKYLTDAQGNVNPFHAPSDRPFFTYLLAGTMVAIWLLGESERLLTGADHLYLFGASYGPLIMSGEYWRLITPIFLHGGMQHLLFNLIALVALGPELERLFGRYRFLLIYLLAGLFGNLLSFAYRGPDELSIGASGAIFGIVGMQLAFFTLYRRQMGEIGAKRRTQVWTIIVSSIIFGSLMGNVNHLAHLGGLLAGSVLGYGLAPRYRVIDHGKITRLYDAGALRQRWWIPLLALILFSLALWQTLFVWG